MHIDLMYCHVFISAKYVYFVNWCGKAMCILWNHSLFFEKSFHFDNIGWFNSLTVSGNRLLRQTILTRFCDGLCQIHIANQVWLEWHFLFAVVSKPKGTSVTGVRFCHWCALFVKKWWEFFECRKWCLNWIYGCIMLCALLWCFGVRM